MLRLAARISFRHHDQCRTLSRTFAFDSRKKTDLRSGPSISKKGQTVTKPTPLSLNDVSSNILQIRTNATKNTPPASSGPTSCPRPPSPPDPPRPDSSDNSSTRNMLIGLFIAAASLGGAYYAGAFDKLTGTSTVEKSTKKQWKPRPVKRYPESKSDFPTKVPYVLIGGGTASFAAFRAIKSRDPTAKVLVISGEDSFPYMRPPLSKEIWQRKTLPSVENLSFQQWNGQERSVYYEPPEFYLNINELESASNGGVVISRGWNVSKVDPSTNTVTLDDPKTNTDFVIQYDKCLIATGCTPKNLPLFAQASPEVRQRTVLYRNIRDLENLWNKLENAQSVAIVGGGFLGSELSCSLGRRFKQSTGAKVYQVFKEPGNMGRVLPEYLSKWTTDKVSNEGVKVITETEVQSAKMDQNKVSLGLSNGESIKADVVIVAVGSEPCTQLAESSLLEVDPNVGGFLVNAELEARSNLYVAGDAACFYDPILGRRRVEHHDHAVVSGRLAGENMTGAAKGYKHQSMFWSDLGPDIAYEAIGIVDASLQTVSVFAKLQPEEAKTESAEKPVDGVEKSDVTPSAPPKEAVAAKTTGDEPTNDYSKGVVFYLQNEMIVGIVLWNVFNKMHTARQVLAERKKYDDLNEIAKLFNIHEN